MGIFRRKQTEQIDLARVVGAGLGGLAMGGKAKALENSSFWICLTNLMRTFATLPLHMYTINGRNRNIDQVSEAAMLLRTPCPYLNSQKWRSIMAFNFELYGVAYAILDRGRTGNVIAMYPVAPSLMRSSWKNGKLIYEYGPSGEKFNSADVLEISNLKVGYTSILSPLDYAQKDISVAESSKALQIGYYKRGTTLGGIITVPRGTSKEVKDQLKIMFNNEFAGEGNAYKTGIIEDSMKYEPIRLTENDSAKMNDAQSWTLQEVCRRFGVPPFFAGDLTKATFANSEQQNLNLIQFSLQPRAVFWESALDEKICKNGQYIKFSMAGFLRGDHSARAAFYQSAIQNGWMTVNEVRALEDLNPVKEGDTLMFPMNYLSLKKAITAEPANNYGIPESVTLESISEPVPFEEKRKADDLSFISEAQAVTRTSRSKVEALIRAQLKAEIAELKRLATAGLDAEGIAAEFKKFTDSLASEYGQKYIPIFKAILDRLFPVVQKQVKTGNDVPEDQRLAYAAKYATSMANRHGNARVKDVTKAVTNLTPDEITTRVDEISQDWITSLPKNESQEETNRAGNAFNLFLFGQLGVTYMHVVANADACEFCKKLDGKVVEVNGAVLDKGENVDDGVGNVRIIQKTYKHPPFHTHCECGIAPGR